MKLKTTIPILALILLSNLSIAYIMPIEHKGIKLKFYHNSIDQEKCYQIIDSIDPIYFKDINYIRVYNTYRSYYLGLYWPSGMIDLIHGCEYETLVHELAHSCQMQKGDHLGIAINHLGHFDSCYKNIMGDPDD